jgi:hypothetical protein
MADENGTEFIDCTIEQIEEACDELEREYNLRERLFPGWIKAGTLSKADARDRQKRLTWAIAVLKRVYAGRNPDDYPLAGDHVGS